MKKKTDDFTIRVDGVQGVCPAGEAWAEQQIMLNKIPVLSCEGPCIRGDIARLAANQVAKNEKFARACYAETFLVPYSAMTRWVKQADKVVMIDGCFLNCLGRVLTNFVNQEKIIHFDALQIYKKYSDLFDMEDVPESERIATAGQVADAIIPQLEAVLD